MNNNIFMAVLFCFSMLFSPSNINLDNMVYSKIGEKICNIDEYGIKIEYIIDKDIESTFRNIKSYIKEENFTEILEKENKIYLNILKEEFNLDINLIEENLYSRIQVIFISKNKLDFNDIYEYFKFIPSKDTKYYTYIKGDIRENYDIDEIEEGIIKSIGKNKVKESSKINLENGTTGMINLNSDYKFNYSIMTYDKDRKLILGSPIIFTAY